MLALDAARHARLTALLDVLLPGDGDAWPAAGALGLADEAWRLAQLDAQHPRLLGELLDRLDGAIDADAVRALEVAEPALVGVAVLLAYNAYYTDARVLDVVASRTGYVARPPQPEGFELEPFDEASLARQRAREPFWRKV